MVELAAREPCYGFDVHKGYASPEHLEALHRHGPCDEHRRSWAIPGGRGGPAVDGSIDVREDATAELDELVPLDGR